MRGAAGSSIHGERHRDAANQHAAPPGHTVLRAERHGAYPLVTHKREGKVYLFVPIASNFINKDDGWCVFFSDSKQFPNEFGPVTQVLLNEFRANHSQESG